MTKNPVLNDLIGVSVFIALMLFLHFIDLFDGLGLWPSLAFVPLLVLTLDSMVRFQFMGIDKPKLSVESIMFAVSWGVVNATVFAVNMADFSNRADVLTKYGIYFTLMTAIWWGLGMGRQVQYTQIIKQTRFTTRQEFDAYRDSHSFKRSEIINAAVIVAISIGTLIWGNPVMGIVILLNVPIILAQNIELYEQPKWYYLVRVVIIMASAGTVVYLTMSGF